MKDFFRCFSVSVLLISYSMWNIPANASAGIIVRIPENIRCAEDHTVTIPVEISGIRDAEIGGYILRLDYDDQILSNPLVITENTLSENNSDLIYGKAWPGDPWDFTVGTGFGFSASRDGILIYIRFDVSAGFVSGSTSVSFVKINQDTYLNTDLLSSGMELHIIPAEYSNGSVISCNSPREEIKETYLPCDFDKNGTGDEADIEMFKKKWMLSCDDPGWNSSCDLQEDSRIDIWDLSYFADCLSEKRP